MSIDMLSMIQEKTKNNLDEYESKLLDQSLKDLKMNFVFEKNSNSNQESETKDQKPEPKEEDKKEEPKKKKAPKKKIWFCGKVC